MRRACTPEAGRPGGATPAAANPPRAVWLVSGWLAAALVLALSGEVHAADDEASRTRVEAGESVVTTGALLLNSELATLVK